MKDVPGVRMGGQKPSVKELCTKEKVRVRFADDPKSSPDYLDQVATASELMDICGFVIIENALNGDFLKDVQEAQAGYVRIPAALVVHS